MKSITLTSLLALFMLAFIAPQSSSAQTAGQSASGTYQFSFEDGYTKYVEFDAKTQTNGGAAGTEFFSDEAKVSYQDVDGTGDPVFKETYAGYSIKANFDDLAVNKNQAVMSGTVIDSTIRSLIGQRVLLTVEDNGTNGRVPDKMTWGIYNPVRRDWTPSDAERKVDDGVGMRWVATDAERKDDVGVVYPRDETISTGSFPVTSYDFADVKAGAGDIVVVP
ncbi:MAG TPA: hypothetical protein VGO91_10300 [Pyrinomonadaceae bacterium]|jgi:hypothetical protein|nr:hypothetical protein [Pyrinomonadaceae bacterium]